MQKQNKTLKDIVVSLELAKELKENGYLQESLFYWELGNYINWELGNYISGAWITDDNKGLGGTKLISSPTATELLNELPGIVVTNGKLILKITKYATGDFNVGYSAVDADSRNIESWTDESIPDALAKMYIYLKQEGLL